MNPTYPKESFTPSVATEIPMPASHIMRKFELSRTTLWRWRSAGLPAQVVGAKIFIKETDVAAFIAAK